VYLNYKDDEVSAVRGINTTYHQNHAAHGHCSVQEQAVRIVTTAVSVSFSQFLRYCRLPH